MGVFNISQAQPLFKELIIGEAPRLYEAEDSLSSYFKKAAKVHKVSDRAVRVTLDAQPGGVTVGMDFNGGGFVAGTGSLFKEFTVQTVGISHNRQLNTKAIWSTATEEVAVKKGLAGEMAAAMVELKAQEDKFLQASNDGVLAIIQSAASAPTYDVNHASNPFGARLLRAGNQYDVYASDMTTRRGTAAWTIVQDGGIDDPGETVTTTASITSGAANDRIVIANMINAAFNGLPYHFSSSSSGTYQGLARTLEYIRAREVAAGTTSLELSYIRRAINAVKRRIGKEAARTLVPYYSSAQEHAYEQLGIAISEIAKGGGDQDLDLLFGDIKFAGKKGMCNDNADPSKIAFLPKGAFQRAELASVGYFGDEVGEGPLFPVYGTTTGVPTAAWWFALTHQWQLICVNPSALVFISGLTVPAGYVG
jgi:hypothetical protein